MTSPSTAPTCANSPSASRARDLDLKDGDPADLDVTVGGPSQLNSADDPLKGREEDGSD